MRRLSALCALLAIGITCCPAATYAVLPFFNLSQNGNLDWVGESLSETVSEALASEGLLVLQRDDREEVYRRMAIRRYAQLTRATVIRIGEALDAGFVVHGSFTASHEPNLPARSSIQISAWVLDLKRMQQSGEFTGSGSLDDLAALQTRVAWRVLHQLAPETAPREEDFRKRRPPVRVDAIENYIRGLLAPTPELKHRFFTQAARLDTGFSQPAYQLGRLLWERRDYRVAAEWLAQVPNTNPHHREAMFLQGLCRYHTGDYGVAQGLFQRLSDQVPLNEVFNNLGAAQSRRNLPEAVQSFRKALEGDTADPDYHFNLGYALWKQGKFEEAADSFRAVLERNPEDKQATSMLGRCLQRTPYRPAQGAAESLERLKRNYEETAYRQLKELLEKR